MAFRGIHPPSLTLTLLICVLLQCHAISLRSQISDTVDITHYRISIEAIDLPGKHLTANAVLNVCPAPGIASLNGIDLELLGLDVDSIDIEGMPVTLWTHASAILHIPLPVPLQSGDTLAVTVHYCGTPQVEPYGWGGFHFQGTTYAYNLGVAIEDVPHNYGKVWFPCVDDFRDRATYEFFVHAPVGMNAVANGVLLGVVTHPDSSATYHWVLRQSIPTYLACVAVSDYEMLTDTFQSLNGPVPVSIHARAADTADARLSFQNLLPVCELFEQRFGPYAWDRVGYVLAPKGAMEHATCITYPANTVDGTLTYEYLYAHELAHMWFGDKVTCANAGEMWLNEGWASFAEYIYKEGLYGKEAMKDYVRKDLRNILQFAHIEEGAYLPLFGIPQQYTYGSTAYEKGACVTHTLRGYLGDSLFFDAIRHYLDTFAFSHATSAGLMEVFEEVSGIGLQDFFDTWVYGPGFPHFRVDSFRIVPPALPPPATVEVFFSQQGKGAPTPLQSQRIEVGFMNDQWQWETRTAVFQGLGGSMTFDLPFLPTLVILDPEERICDAATKVIRTVKAGGKLIFPETFFELDVLHVQDSALVHAVHHWVAPEPPAPAVPGFRISDYRYWSVQGAGLAGLQAHMRFFFTRFSHLDNGVILHPADSIVLLYRPGPGHAWMPVAAQLEGQTYQGYMVTDSVLPGDYAIGVWDHTFLGLDEQQEEVVLIYPNPSADSFTISCNHEGITILRVFSADGRQVASLHVDPALMEVRWDAAGLPSGQYFILAEDRAGNPLGSFRAIRL